jgi:hypothetical protein
VASVFLRPFDIHGLGIEEAKTTSEEYEDRIRFFAEECDYLEGFQVVVDADSGFGGYGSEMIRYLSDDFGSKSVAVFPCSSSVISGEFFDHFWFDLEAKTSETIFSTNCSIKFCPS